MVHPEITKANDLSKRGEKKKAAHLLYEYLLANPSDALAWYEYEKYLNKIEKRITCLKRALELQPDFPAAKKELDELFSLQASQITKEKTNNGFTITHYPADGTDNESASAPPQMLTTRKIANKLAQERQGYKQSYRLLWVFMIVVGAIIIIYSHNSQLMFLVIVVLLLAKLFASRLFDNHAHTNKKYRAYEKGARGEETIVDLLSTLGPDFAVWHDVMTNRGNIDHVVLCKNGTLFMIETKANSGTVDASCGTLLLNGRRPPKDMIAQCLRNTYYVKSQIETNFGKEVWVTPILVFTNAFVHSGSPIKGVKVVNKKYLLENIRPHSTRAEQDSWLWVKRSELARILHER